MAEIINNLDQKYSFDETNKSFALTEVKNTELDKIGEPKDEINVEIGDSKDNSAFFPQVKMMRWTNEVNFSVRLKDEDTVNTAKVSTETEKIIWDKGSIKIEMYDYQEGEGGYKFVWFLKEKPLTNKVEFTIQSKGLDFFYQPPMTEEKLEKGQTADETHIYDSKGNVIAFRPENVVGSYAVYHQTKGGMNDINGKDYKCGKAFHIYRPHIIDAEGKNCWGNLHIENGIYSVEIPQEFLDKAVYPIKSNDTLGVTTIGASDNTTAAYFMSNITDSAGSDGTMTKIQIAVYDAGGDSNVKLAVYNNSSGAPGSLVANSYSGEITVTRTTKPTQDSEWTSNSGISGAVVSGSAYFVASNKVNTTINTSYDSTGGTNRYKAQTYTSFPTDPAPSSTSSNNTKWSMYFTYTPSGGGTAVKDIIQMGFISFPR